MNRWVPVLPESAPFTPEQRAYLNGYLAGLFSFSQVPQGAAAPIAPPAAPVTPLTVLYASQTGTAEKLAKRAAKEASKRGFAPTLHDLAQYPTAQLASESAVLVLASTFGDGEPPDAARAFWTWLNSDAAPKLARTRFSVCALGDTNYTKFCQFGRDLDARLERLGGTRVTPRSDCDVEFERPFQAWLGSTLSVLGTTAPGAEAAASAGSSEAEPAEPPAPRWSRNTPFPARLKTNRRLSSERSAKDVRHFEIILDDPELSYEVGDALGVWPTNCPELVDAVLNTLGSPAEAAVPGRDGNPVPFRAALLEHYELGRIPMPLLQHVAKTTGDSALQALVAPSANGTLDTFLRGRDVLDLLQSHPSARPDPAALVALLRKLQPRLYSISSSPKAHPGEVHLTVSAVRYQAHGRDRRGVASCFLADRCDAGARLPVFVHANPAFRPPAPDAPLIMIGPGTGIAPFRAFLEERRAIGARGQNWLLFGDQHEATDYLYRDELETFRREGTLHRLDLAWSRDQDRKVYVQDRLGESAMQVWDWLEQGASVCVCGDASRMAKDVDAALHRVVQEAGGRTPEAAQEYIQALQTQKRYVRDVY